MRPLWGLLSWQLLPLMVVYGWSQSYRTLLENIQSDPITALGQSNLPLFHCTEKHRPFGRCFSMTNSMKGKSKLCINQHNHYSILYTDWKLVLAKFWQQIWREFDIWCNVATSMVRAIWPLKALENQRKIWSHWYILIGSDIPHSILRLPDTSP